MSDLISLGEVALRFLSGNYGGTVISLLLIAGLYYRLHHCEKRHGQAEEHIDKLSAAVIQLHGALAQVTGKRIIDIEDLQALLQPGGSGRAIRYSGPPAP